MVRWIDCQMDGWSLWTVYGQMDGWTDEQLYPIWNAGDDYLAEQAGDVVERVRAKQVVNQDVGVGIPQAVSCSN
jgi:hypothetical protein